MTSGAGKADDSVDFDNDYRRIAQAVSLRNLKTTLGVCLVEPVFLSDVDVQQTISRQPARVKVRSSSSGRWSVNLFERSPSIR